jgi:hypothetical protein
MSETFYVGARPRPYLLPRLRVAGDLLRFEACPLRYRLHGVGAWPEADADASPRLAGTLVHAALDHAGTACRPRAAGGEGLPPNDDVALQAIAEARRLVDAVSPRANRSVALNRALGDAERLARRTILELGPFLFPHLTATEQRVAATRQHLHRPSDERGRQRRLRNVERFEVSGVLDAVVAGIVPDPDGAPIAALIHGALRQVSTRPIGAVIDYKLARRPHVTQQDQQGEGTTGDQLGSHAFQVAAYACIRNDFLIEHVQVGIVIYLYDLFPELDPLGASTSGSDLNTGRYALADDTGETPRQAQSIGSRLQRAASVVVLDENVFAEATARIDRLGAAIEACAEREAASVPPRLAWPARRSEFCGTCDVQPMCPEWQDVAWDAQPVRHQWEYDDGEPEDG